MSITQSPPDVAGEAVESMAIWADYLRSHALIVDELSRELAEAGGMPLSWYDVLLHLDAADAGRLRMQELAAAVVLSKSGLTRLVDRLERAGFVARVDCPEDRRGTFAAITDAGRSALQSARPVHLAGVDRHFAAVIDPADAPALARVLRALVTANGRSAFPDSCGMKDDEID